MLSGAGAIAAFDSRSTSPTPLGGLLQSSTYLAGLSGGSWLVGTIYTQNYTSVQDILNNDGPDSIWNLENSVATGMPQVRKCIEFD